MFLAIYTKHTHPQINYESIKKIEIEISNTKKVDSMNMS